MYTYAIYEGLKEKTSSKGNKYGEIFIKGLKEDGTADFERVKLRTFSEDIINLCKSLKTSEAIKIYFSVNDLSIIIDNIVKKQN